MRLDCCQLAFVAILLVSLTGVQTQSLSPAESNASSNPLFNIFDYDPQALLSFLFDSLDPQYQALNSATINGTLQSIVQQGVNNSQPWAELLDTLSGGATVQDPLLREIDSRIDYFLEQLENKQTVNDELWELLDSLANEVLRLSSDDRNEIRTSSFLSILLDEINNQLVSLYQKKSYRLQWSSSTSVGKLIDLLTDYDFASTGESFLESSWYRIDDGTPLMNTVKTRMVDFMEVLESESVSVNNTINLFVGNSSLLRYLTKAPVMMTALNSLTEQLQLTYNKTSQQQQNSSQWNVLGADEKIVQVLQGINVTILRQMFDAVMRETHTQNQEKINPKLSDLCARDLDQFMAALRNPFVDMRNPWALQMIDAWGKLPPGVLRGNLNWPGEMNECIEIKVNRSGVQSGGSAGQLEGAWSMVGINLPSNLLSGGDEGAAGLPAGMSASLKLGFCLPASCDMTDLKKFWSRLELIGSNATSIKRRADYPAIRGDYKTDPKFIGVTAFLVFMVLTVTLCSLVDRYHLTRQENLDKKLSDKSARIALEKLYDVDKAGVVNNGYSHDHTDSQTQGLPNGHAVKEDIEVEPAKQNVCSKFIKSFSLYQTLPKLMDATPKPGQLQGLDAIRFFSMTWVILGHVWGMAASFANPANIRDAMSQGKDGDWTFAGVMGGLFAVDSFFLLSGLLVGYLFLKALHKRKGRVSCKMMTLYYVHRFIRFLPIYGGLILIDIAYTKYMAIGPFAPDFNNLQFPEFCEKVWWKNLLYINNLYKPREVCQGVTWYLANDMQFYWISPIILIPLYKVPMFGLGLLAVIWATHIGIDAWILSGFTAVGLNGGAQQAEFMEKEYTKPWCRIGPYLIGILLAYVLFKKYRIKSTLMKAVLWIVSLGGITVNVYIMYDFTKEDGVMGSSWDRIDQITYDTMKRSSWAACLAWIVYACNTGCAGPIGSILNWSGWAPLAKLSYAAYMFHMIVLQTVWQNSYVTSYYETWTLVQDNISFVCLSYAVGFFFYLILEAPMAGIERVILPSSR